MFRPFRPLDLESTRRSDDRGHLEVLFEHGNLVLKRSFSRAGVFRGLHRQNPPHAQNKLIRVVSGRILDFVADPSALNPVVHARKLDALTGWILIEDRYAHGFYALDDTLFEYVCDGAYSESHESTYSITRQLHDTLGIKEPLMSPKDAAAAPLDASIVLLDP